MENSFKATAIIQDRDDDGLISGDDKNVLMHVLKVELIEFPDGFQEYFVLITQKAKTASHRNEASK